ncbi:hypothetical protein TNIN_254161 [Trichonephila inaurata madagascariensis]|uniref:Uncharacterized protein n=1 Tax=Trichonephila inaurata madagascariensis TaxID=2747483 RepID=A0A8X7C3W7_9ARAC|nr:hypothetical protein TNIN_254161 [Trichonephila inaurata madagascariensis]
MRAVKDGLKEARQLTDSAVEEQIRTHDQSFSRGYVDSYLEYRNEKLAKGKTEAALFNGLVWQPLPPPLIADDIAEDIAYWDSLELSGCSADFAYWEGCGWGIEYHPKL